jgi:hypothetical protein
MSLTGPLQSLSSTLDRIPELARFWKPILAGVLAVTVWAAFDYPGRPLGAAQRDRLIRGVREALEEYALRDRLEQSCHERCDGAELSISSLHAGGIGVGVSREGHGDVRFELICEQGSCPMRAHYSYRWTTDSGSPRSLAAAVRFASFEPPLVEYDPVDDIIRQVQ